MTNETVFLDNIEKLKEARLNDYDAVMKMAFVNAGIARFDNSIAARTKMVIATGYATGKIKGSNDKQRKAAENLHVAADEVLQQLEEEQEAARQELPAEIAKAANAKVERQYQEDLNRAYLALIGGGFTLTGYQGVAAETQEPGSVVGTDLAEPSTEQADMPF